MLKILQIPRFPSAEMQDLTLTYETASSPFRGEVSSRETKAIKIHAILRETWKGNARRRSPFHVNAVLNLSIVILCHRESIIHWLWHSLCHLFFSFSENIGIKNAKLFEGDMILSTAQRLAAMKGLDLDRARGNARGSVMNMQWPGGVMIYDIATKIGEDKWSKDRYEKRVK